MWMLGHVHALPVEPGKKTRLVACREDHRPVAQSFLLFLGEFDITRAKDDLHAEI